MFTSARITYMHDGVCVGREVTFKSTKSSGMRIRGFRFEVAYLDSFKSFRSLSVRLICVFNTWLFVVGSRRFADQTLRNYFERLCNERLVLTCASSEGFRHGNKIWTAFRFQSSGQKVTGRGFCDFDPWKRVENACGSSHRLFETPFTCRIFRREGHKCSFKAQREIVSSGVEIRGGGGFVLLQHIEADPWVSSSTWISQVGNGCTVCAVLSCHVFFL